MRKLYSGIEIPTIIDTSVRVFRITTFDNETLLCNLDTAYMLLKKDHCKELYHLWDCKFKRFGKSDLKGMYETQQHIISPNQSI